MQKDHHPRVSFNLRADGRFGMETNVSLAFQIFSNIISNAAEYCSKTLGKVTVELRRKDNSYVFLCRDNGIGIPKEDCPKIFDKFFRASNANRMKREGTGLGLYVVKTIADYLGLKVSFKTALGRGSTFFVKIPIR